SEGEDGRRGEDESGMLHYAPPRLGAGPGAGTAGEASALSTESLSSARQRSVTEVQRKGPRTAWRASGTPRQDEDASVPGPERTFRLSRRGRSGQRRGPPDRAAAPSPERPLHTGRRALRPLTPLRALRNLPPTPTHAPAQDPHLR